MLSVATGVVSAIGALTPNELAKLDQARRLSDAGWLTVAFLSIFRRVRAYGFETMPDAVKSDGRFVEDIVVSSMQQRFSANAVDPIRTLAELGKYFQDRQGEGSGKGNDNGSLDRLIDECSHGLREGLGEVNRALKLVRSLRNRNKVHQQNLQALERALASLEGVLLSELAVADGSGQGAAHGRKKRA